MHVVSQPNKKSVSTSKLYKEIGDLINNYNPIIYLFGIRGAGKTHLLIELLNSLETKPTATILFKNTQFDNTGNIPCDRVSELKTVGDVKLIANLIEAMKVIRSSLPEVFASTRILLVFDDILSGLTNNAVKLLFNKIVSELVYNGRHLNISVIISTQVFNFFIDKRIRSNIDMILLRSIPLEYLRTFRDTYFPELKLKDIREIKSQLDASYDVLKLEQRGEPVIVENRDSE